MARGFEGEHISDAVITQINKRSEAIANTNAAYLSERAPHVRLLSSVVVDGDKSVAENNILANGTVVDNILPRFDGTVDSTRSLGAGYKNTELGFRPVPGITSATIKSQNRFGSLRTAEISFTVWSKDDLDNLEQLYLRPGYSCVLEFCHTIRVSNKGVIEREPVTLDNSIWDTNQDSIKKQIKQKRVDSDYNYDGYFGFIRNFGWSFRQDGGYDCTVSLVTKGALLESINAAVYSSGVKPLAIPSDNEDPPATGSLSDSDISSFLGALLQISNGEEVSGYSVKQPVIEVDAGEDTPVGEFTYITMRSFLDLANSLSVVYDKKNKRVPTTRAGSSTQSTATAAAAQALPPQDNTYIPPPPIFPFLDPGIPRRRDASVLFDTGLSDKMRTIPSKVSREEHYSIDMGVCMTQNRWDFKNDPNKQNQIGGEVIFYDYAFRKNLFKINDGQSDDILNIALNVEFLFRSIRSQLVSLASKNILQIVQIVLDEVERALGSINQFDIAFDEAADMHYIVDRALVGYGKNRRGDKILPPIFPLTGKGAIAKSLTMQSSITSNLASQIAIAATAAGKNSSVLTTTNQDLVDWNRNLSDRWSETLPIDSAYIDGIESEFIRSYRVIKEFFKSLKTPGPFNTSFETTVLTPISYSKTRVQQAMNAFSSRKNYTIQEIKRINPSIIEGSLGGIIPITVSFKIDGIAGLKIGQTFRVSDKLIPSSYADKGVAFIINGLDESITSEGWVSNISAQMFIVNPNINN